MRSICPTSKMFDKTAGTAEDQLGRMIAAKIAACQSSARCLAASRIAQTDDTHIDDIVRC